jgi:hypothetical protein
MQLKQGEEKKQDKALLWETMDDDVKQFVKMISEGFGKPKSVMVESVVVASVIFNWQRKDREVR